MKFGLIFAMAVSTSLLAQTATNTAPGAPAALIMDPVPVPATNAPAKKPAKKKAASAAKKPAAKAVAKKALTHAPELKTVPLVAGPAVVVASHVNVRTRAGLSGEVLTKLTNGEPVTVIEEIKLKHSGPEEPSAWAKIALPASAHAWIKSSYIDATNKTVIPKKLNLRGGPSENYGVLGQVRRGDSVTEIETKGEWTQITPPTGAFAFVAAQYLSQESTAIAAANSTGPSTTAEKPATPATVPETAAIAATTTETPALTASTNKTSEIISNELAAAMSSTVSFAPPQVELPPPPRIVQREGIVRGNTSIQSPTKFELINPENRQLINYLYTTSTNLDLNRYKGLHIIVTGEEGMDERWKYTPVITIQRIQVLE